MMNNTSQGIQIYPENPFYWQYKGKPVLLLGGSVEDNLFQIDDLKPHLELLHAVGGNYIRCTMSSRDEGDVKPYSKDAKGLFDLDQFNPEYWQKFERLLRYCEALDIIVQVEIWATYDFYWGEMNWAANPFNPGLNRNYTAEESGLPNEILLPAQSENNPFFKSIPALDNHEIVLSYQHKFVDQLLSISFPHGNVLYCIDNETLAPHPWGKYWAAYLHAAAAQQGKEIYVTEMWDYWDPTAGAVEGAVGQSPTLGDWYADYTNPDLHRDAQFSFSLNDPISYQFVDISNHNAQKGETHAQTARWIREAVKATGKIRPINNVKIYGGDMDNIWAGNRRDGKERFCRDIFSGHASVRFHRPICGMGLNDEAQHFIKSARLLTNHVNFFTFTPANHLLQNRQANEAYCMANDAGEYLLYFPGSGGVSLDIEAGVYQLKRLHIPTSEWQLAETVEMPSTLEVKTDDHWFFVLRKMSLK